MEAKTSESAWFLTLTYNDDNLPLSPETYAPVLRHKDVRRYLARLRATRGGGLKFRYYLCGEYGDRTLRPHYHAILYFSQTRPAPADLEATLDRYWGHGHTLLAEANEKTFQYVSHYIVKKAKHHEFEVPEYQTMSTNPALGTEFINRLGNLYLDSKALQLDLEKTEDVRNSFRYNGQVWPIDPYMRNKLRDHVGVPRLRSERHEGMSLDEVLVRNWREQPTEKDYEKARIYNERIIRRISSMARTL